MCTKKPAKLEAHTLNKIRYVCRACANKINIVADLLSVECIILGMSVEKST